MELVLVQCSIGPVQHLHSAVVVQCLQCRTGAVDGGGAVAFVQWLGKDAVVLVPYWCRSSAVRVQYGTTTDAAWYWCSAGTLRVQHWNDTVAVLVQEEFWNTIAVLVLGTGMLLGRHCSWCGTGTDTCTLALAVVVHLLLRQRHCRHY